MNGTHFSPDDTPPRTAPKGQLTPPPRWPPTAVGAATPEPAPKPHRELPASARPFGYYVVKAVVRLTQQIAGLLVGGRRSRDPLRGFRGRAG
jgi:hypothetical protein